MSEKLSVIQNYLRVRLTRLNELEELLTDEDFTFIREYATPFASEVLADGVGFLYPSDLSEFDRSIDYYINGDFYNCPASGFEIVENLTNLRDKRENDLYATILATTQQVLAALSVEDPKAWGPAVYTKVIRPWGRKGENASCHVISLHAFLKPAPKRFLFFPSLSPEKSFYHSHSLTLPSFSLTPTSTLLLSLALYLLTYMYRIYCSLSVSIHLCIPIYLYIYIYSFRLH